jgi:L-2,4-diaminobutyrate decarboxylase
MRGTAMVAATKVDGRCWLKLTLLNPMATRDDILAITRQVVEIGDELALTTAVA